MANDIAIVYRTLSILLSLLIITRILGRRTLSELTFYDFVIGLVIGNIGTAVITDEDFSMRSGLVALAVATLWILSLSMLSLNSVPARKLIEAEPLTVLHNGKILENNLKKRFYNVNDLLEMLRNQGIFDPTEVAIALIEPDGQLSVLKKPKQQSNSGKDYVSPKPNLTQADILAGTEIIINGKLIDQGLAQSGLTQEQLKQHLINMGVTDLQEVTLAIITPNGQLYIDTRNDSQQPAGFDTN